MRTEGTGPLRVLALAVAALLPLDGTRSPARADPVSLQDLLDGQRIQVGDKEFSGFAEFQSVVAGGAIPVAPAAVMVEPFSGPSGVGLRFLGGNEFQAPPGGSQETSFRYFVASPLPIVDFELGLSGGVLGTGSVRVLETIRNFFSGELIDSETVFINPDDSQLTARGTFPPQLILDIRKTIRVSGPAGVTDFTQTFSQVPEPSSLTLLGLGTLGLVGYAWHRRRPVAPALRPGGGLST